MFKNGDKMLLSNYSGINFLGATRKLTTKITTDKINDLISVEDEQHTYLLNVDSETGEVAIGLLMQVDEVEQAIHLGKEDSIYLEKEGNPWSKLNQ